MTLAIRVVCYKAGCSILAKYEMNALATCNGRGYKEVDHKEEGSQARKVSRHSV